jgi:hypothetical protein
VEAIGSVSGIEIGPKILSVGTGICVNMSFEVSPGMTPSRHRVSRGLHGRRVERSHGELDISKKPEAR